MSGGVTSKPFDLEAEVRDLAARRDIVACIGRYMRGQDRLLPDVHRSAFHDDAWVDCGIMSGTADEFVTFAQDFLGTMKASLHIIGQTLISVDGDAATGEIYFFAFHRIVEEGEERDLLMSGRYIDDYACRNGDWRILRRRELIDWVRKDSATDQFLESMPGVIFGGRRGEDFGVTRDWAAVGAPA